MSNDYKRLDPDGLEHYTGKVKNLVDEKLTLVSLTESEYNQLPSADKNKTNVIYELSDVPGGSGSSNFGSTAGNLPYNHYLDITSINGSNATGIKQTATGTFTCEEMWLE